jgi:aspartyl-tRNA synthetase
MERTYIKDLRNAIGQTVQINGWLQTLRDQKKLQFLIMRDPTGLVQVVHWKPNDEALAEQISKLGQESALIITGKVIDNPVVKLGGLELQLESLTVENNAEIPLPFDPFAETLPLQDFRLDWRYLDLRRPVNNLLFKVETTAENAMREYWVKNNFIEIHSPKLVSAPSESGA